MILYHFDFVHFVFSIGYNGGDACEVSAAIWWAIIQRDNTDQGSQRDSTMSRRKKPGGWPWLVARIVLVVFIGWMILSSFWSEDPNIRLLAAIVGCTIFAVGAFIVVIHFAFDRSFRELLSTKPEAETSKYRAEPAVEPLGDSAPKLPADSVEPPSIRSRDPGFSWAWTAVILLLMVVSFFLFIRPEDLGTGINLRMVLVVCSPLLALGLGFAGFVFFKYWILTRWERLAYRPSVLLARGDAQAAERAFENLKVRAQGFPRMDVRRGTLLAGMCVYLANKGSVRESIAMFQECLEVLTRHAQTAPVPYMYAMETYAMVLVQVKDYAEAQKVEEKIQDWIPVAKKRLGNVVMLLYDEWELSVRLRLTCLFIQIGALAEARRQLNQARGFLGAIQGERKQFFHDHILACSAMLKHAEGDFFEAWRDCEQIGDAEDPFTLTIRAKISLARQQFSQAEELLRRRLDLWWPNTTRRHPALFDPTLDLAEAQFGQAKHADAFVSLQEARSIAADFALPPDSAWKETLQTWLQRARDLGNTDLAASLDAELQKIPEPVDRAITILEKFRVHNQYADE